MEVIWNSSVLIIVVNGVGGDVVSRFNDQLFVVPIVKKKVSQPVSHLASQRVSEIFISKKISNSDKHYTVIG